MTKTLQKPAHPTKAIGNKIGAFVIGFGVFACLGAPTASAFPLKVGDRWDWQLSGPVDLDRDVEMLGLDPDLVTREQLEALRAQGIDTVCHVNVGTLVQGSPEGNALPAATIGNTHEDDPQERYLDIRRVHYLVPVITKRFVACKDQGFTAIEPDNLDVHVKDSGFPISQADAIRYATTLAHVAHGLGLRIAQKNAPDLTGALQPHFDMAISDGCFEKGICEHFAAYPKANKPAFNAEYTDTDIEFGKACAEGARLNINMIRKDRTVSAPVITCQAEY